MNLKVTPQMIRALATLRTNVRSDETSESVAQAIVILDDAGVFAAIDAVAPCTCPRTYGGEFLRQGHRTDCPNTN